MMEAEIFNMVMNYGGIGVFCGYLVYKDLVLNKRLITIIEQNTESLKLVLSGMVAKPFSKGEYKN